MTGGFIIDDRILIEENPHIQKIQGVGFYLAQEDGIVDKAQWPEDTHTGYYRPLINLTYTLDYLFWGMDPRGFRATNLFLHLLTCIALYRLLTMMCQMPIASAATVLVFGLHPVMSEAVAFISARNNILVTLFSLSALICHIKFLETKRRWLLAVSLLFFSCALLSKEFGVMLLPILFLYHYFIVRNRASFSETIALYFPFAALIALYLWLRIGVTGSIPSIHGGGGLGQRLFFVPYLIVFNFRLLAMPFNLHSFWITYPPRLLGPEGLMGVFGLSLIGYLLWRGRKNPVLAFSVLTFLIGLIPVLNIVKTASSTLISMRWLYFPSVFLTFYLCHRFASGPNLRLLTAIVIVLVSGLGVATYTLNRDQWHDEVGFYEREVLDFKNYYYALGLANIYHDRGQWRKAEQLYLETIRRFPENPSGYVDYSGLLVEQNRFQAAFKVIEKAQSLFMSRQMKGHLYNNKAMALMRIGKKPEALQYFQKAVALAPNRPSFAANLGGALGAAGRVQEAIGVLAAGCRRWPESVVMTKNLILACSAAKNDSCTREALARLSEKTVQNDPQLKALVERLDSDPR